ncbi:hypothetical protein GPY61_19930 [Massilia sp. NEAU-DD11]|uniref:Ribosomal protein S3AE n=1 Tax=Massilia cellulosiltytica TaxID=2683234 RepID=A0A7X3K8Q0_9BURK|nr:hypothetical protein [Telluria cellulosilytica]
MQQVSIPIRTECPPGACVCEREILLADPDADLRPLRLTRTEEQKLIERIDAVASYDDLKRLQERIRANLGVELKIAPGPNEVRTLRGILIVLEDRPGLCKKVRQSVPAAVRRVLERHPGITYAILDAHDLFGAGGA